MSDNSFWEQMQINDMVVIDTIRKYGRDTIYFKDKDSKFIWNNYMHANQLGVIKPEEMIGKTVRVLVEDFDPVSEMHFGRGDADAPEIDGKIYFSARRRIAPGSIVSVKIEDVLDYDLCGRALLFPEA